MLFVRAAQADENKICEGNKNKVEGWKDDREERKWDEDVEQRETMIRRQLPTSVEQAIYAEL